MNDSNNNIRDIDREKRAMIEQKRRRRRRRRRERSVAIDATAAGNAASLDLNTYNSYQKISLYLRRIADDHPDIVQLLNFTKTSEGRDLLGVKIGKRFARKGQIEAATDNDDGLVMTTTGKRPLIFLDAGVHARFVLFHSLLANCLILPFFSQGMDCTGRCTVFD